MKQKARRLMMASNIRLIFILGSSQILKSYVRNIPNGCAGFINLTPPCLPTELGRLSTHIRIESGIVLADFTLSISVTSPVTRLLGLDFNISPDSRFHPIKVGFLSV